MATQSIYIDGEHRHNIVLADYHAWAPHLTPNATIAFDDYGGSVGAEVVKAVKELEAKGALTFERLVGSRLAIATPGRKHQ